MHRNTEESARDPFFPCIAELDARDFRQNINAHRSNPNLIHHLLLRECLRTDPVMLEGSAKLPERFDHSNRILGRIVYPYVEIFCVTWLAILHDCEAANDQI